MTWTLDDGVALCRQIEAVCPEYGCHVALTGGVLYKDGPRKDLDLVVYRIRQEDDIDVAGLFGALSALGIMRVTKDDVWCVKAEIAGRRIDLFFPEAEEGEYPDDDDDDDQDEPGDEPDKVVDDSAEIPF